MVETMLERKMLTVFALHDTIYSSLEAWCYLIDQFASEEEPFVMEESWHHLCSYDGPRA